MYELLGNIAFYSPLIINPEKLIKNPEISSDGASANLALKLPPNIYWLLLYAVTENILASLLIPKVNGLSVLSLLASLP